VAGLAGIGSKTGEAGDGAAVQASQLGHLGEQRSGGHGSDAPDAGKQILLAPGRTGAHLRVDRLVESGQLAFQGLDEAGQASGQPAVADAPLALPLGHQHGDTPGPPHGSPPWAEAHGAGSGGGA